MNDAKLVNIGFDNHYARLPERFYVRQAPDPVATPGVIRVNEPLARHLGIDPRWLGSDAGAEVIAGNQIPEGAEPIATAYAGHQFGSFNPQLGDGRAVLLGEIVGQDGIRYDLQLKGSGPTSWSRGGDGRAPLGPVLREYIVSEAMAVLGIPTSRALAAVTTGETVYREVPLPGAVLARVAKSHIRVGTFEIFASRQDDEAVHLLADHVIDRHYPEARQTDHPYLAMLQAVIEQQASLIALWQSVGFIHGVMNTDNMLLSGETIDYGPCAFMDSFDPNTVYSSIDVGGRYAYGNQPVIAQWNLAKFAQSILPLLGDDRQQAIAEAQEAIDAFPERYAHYYHQVMLRKLGIVDRQGEDDEVLLQDLLELMAQTGEDFTLTFRRLTDIAAGTADSHVLPEAYNPWLARWRTRLAEEHASPESAAETMRAVNPAYIPRNHLVEEAIEAAVNDNDFKPFHDFMEVLSHPYEEASGLERYTLPPRPDQVVRQTFCGT